MDIDKTVEQLDYVLGKLYKIKDNSEWFTIEKDNSNYYRTEVIEVVIKLVRLLYKNIELKIP